MPYRQDQPSWADQPTEVLPVSTGSVGDIGTPDREPPSHRPAPGRTRIDPARLDPSPYADPITDPHGLPLLSAGRGPLGGPGGDGPDGPDPSPAPPDWLPAALHPLWRGAVGLSGRFGKHSGPAAVVFGVLSLVILVYLVDLVATSGDVPRGTVVAGVDIGGRSKGEATAMLRAALAPRQDRPVPVRAGVLETSLQPSSAGLRIDWAGTVAAAGNQPLNPFTRIGSFFGSREVQVRTLADDDALADVLDGMSTLIRKEPTDGGVRFEGTQPTAVAAKDGEQLDVPGAAAAIRRDWLTGATITLPIKPIPPAGGVGEEAVRTAITQVAEPAVSGEVRVAGDNEYEAILTPFTIAGALSFAPDGNGGLNPVLDLRRIEDALRPQLAFTERTGRDATVRLRGGRPVIEPSEDGHGVDYPASLAGLLEVLKRPADPANPTARRIVAVYADQPAKRTTEQLESLGIEDLVSQFSTSGFAKDSGQNIRRAAEQINGKILLPGETFSLNEATGVRDAAGGYVEAGVIQDGHPDRAIGGGVSQLATTLYNAAYFAGMVDVAHKEHSYFISRYPPAREATVFGDIIDLKFRNEGPTAIFIETVWSPSSIAVKFWGTKHYEVTSTPGPRTNPVPPQTLTVPAGEPCKASEGGEGFTTTDTRTLRDVDSGEERSNTRTVKYKPSPKIVCAGGPASGDAAPGASTPGAPGAPPATPPGR